MNEVQGPHLTFQQMDLLLHAHLEDAHDQEKRWARAALEELEGMERVIHCSFWDHVEDADQAKVTMDEAAKQQDKYNGDHRLQVQQLALQEPCCLAFCHMDTQMEMEQCIWEYVQGNLLEQEQESNACCLHDHGDGDDGRDDHDVAWVLD